MDKVEFAILGAGAIGSIIGAHLSKAGHSVAMLARGQRAQQIQAEGLRIKGLADLSEPVPVLQDPARLKKAEVLIVATKAIGTAASLQPLRHVELGTAFSVQNGVMKNELLTSAFGREPVLGALANLSGELLPTGEVLFTRNVNLLLGELEGSAGARAQNVSRLIDSAGVRSIAVPDIQIHEWSKFVAWVGMVVLAVTTRVNTWKYLQDPGAALVLVRLVRELQKLASACNVKITDDAMFPVATLCRGTEEQAVDIIKSLGREFRKSAPQHRLSTLQDLEAGRRLEIEETLGFAVNKAAEKALSLPLLDAFYHVTDAIDRTQHSR